MSTIQNKELFVMDIASSRNVEVALNGYSREVNAQIYISSNDEESTTTLTIAIGNDTHQLLEHTQTLNESIDELCLVPSIKGEYLSVEISGADTTVQIKNQQDEKGIITDLFDSQDEFIGGLGYLREDDVLEIEKEVA